MCFILLHVQRFTLACILPTAFGGSIFLPHQTVGLAGNEGEVPFELRLFPCGELLDQNHKFISDILLHVIVLQNASTHLPLS